MTNPVNTVQRFGLFWSADKLRNGVMEEFDHGNWVRAEDYDALCSQLTAEAKRLDWLERNHTLHKSVAILYVVDGYAVQVSENDGNTLVFEAHGEDLREAIDKCMENVP